MSIGGDTLTAMPKQTGPSTTMPRPELIPFATWLGAEMRTRRAILHIAWDLPLTA